MRYELKTPYRDGTAHVIFEPLDIMAKLAALVPKPRVNLTRFHGVFAPNSNDFSECEKCKGPMKIIACIEDPVDIEKILNHLKAKEANPAPPSTQLPPRQDAYQAKIAGSTPVEYPSRFAINDDSR